MTATTTTIYLFIVGMAALVPDGDQYILLADHRGTSAVDGKCVPSHVPALAWYADCSDPGGAKPGNCVNGESEWFRHCPGEAGMNLPKKPNDDEYWILDREDLSFTVVTTAGPKSPGPGNYSHVDKVARFDEFGCYADYDTWTSSKPPVNWGLVARAGLPDGWQFEPCHLVEWQVGHGQPYVPNLPFAREGAMKWKAPAADVVVATRTVENLDKLVVQSESLDDGRAVRKIELEPLGGTIVLVLSNQSLPFQNLTKSRTGLHFDHLYRFAEGHPARPQRLVPRVAGKSNLQPFQGTCKTLTDQPKEALGSLIKGGVPFVGRPELQAYYQDTITSLASRPICPLGDY